MDTSSDVAVMDAPETEATAVEPSETETSVQENEVDTVADSADLVAGPATAETTEVTNSAELRSGAASLATEMAAVDAKVNEQVAAEKKRLAEKAALEKRMIAAQHQSAALAELDAAVAVTTDSRVKAAYDQVKMIRGALTSTAVDVQTVAERRRTRRPVDSLQADAKAILGYVAANPGSRAGAIGKATGVDFGQSIGKFVEKYGGGAKLSGTGERAARTYTVAA